MEPERYFVFGAGYSGKAFAAGRPPGTPVTGTTRRAANISALRAAGLEPLLFDGMSATDDLKAALSEVTHLLVSVAPDDDGDPVLRTLGGDIETAMPALRWIAYLSTVGVYGDHQGGWIDETAECRPVSTRSKRRVEAEAAWQDMAARRGVPLAVLRLSGIYGPGRNALLNLAEGKARRLVKPGQVFNRIHVADIAGALWHLAERRTGGIFNVTDDLPAPPQDVVAYAAELMGMEPPPEIPFETADLSPMARSFYGENKRVSNAAIRATGYAFRYPDYRQALSAMWVDGSWRGGSRDGRSPIRRG